MTGLFGGSPQVVQASEVKKIEAPVVNQEVVDRQTQDIMTRRRGQGATVTGAGSIGSTAGSVAAKQLLGQ